MPKVPDKASRVELDATTLAMLLDGIDVKYVRRPATWSPPTSLLTPA
jgi:transposase